MSNPLVVEYFSDILCVWAWITQRRIDELTNDFDSKIELQYHYIDVFGDTKNKIQTQWRERGGYRGFAQHIRESAAPYKNAPVSTKIWNDVRPMTSANAHLVLKAAEIVVEGTNCAELAFKIRNAFFIDAKDISQFSVLYEIVEACALDIEKIDNCIGDGSAMASLMSDYQIAKKQGIKGSPSFNMNSGRQTLYGNVGYRILKANIDERLHHHVGDASWC
ncbi:DsbA family oxidoreductase [Aliikangiella sp. IMCC44359]|uniref:DsbA family oxidoreductase n=1 Tax=Aliikangiella sp. IMCC44359 TaxID=3459125 RepID=UPI00403B0D91